MEALMQDFHATGFKVDVSKLSAVPMRPLTNCMDNDMWLGFADRAVEQEIDLLDPISYMYLGRTRVTAVLPEWDLGVECDPGALV